MSTVGITPVALTPTRTQPPRDHTVTPRAADAWKQCAYRVAHAPKETEASAALRRGTLIHEMLRLDGQRIAAGQPQLDAEDVAMQGCADDLLKDDPDFLNHAVTCVLGARRFLTENGLTILQTERYVRSAYRDVVGEPSLRVRFSGKIDAVAHDEYGRLVLLDYKIGRTIPTPLDLSALPSSFVYSYLGRCLRDQDHRVASVCGSEIVIMQLLPHLGRSALSCLTRDEMRTGALLVRQMVVDMDRGHYTPVPGEHCAYCPIKETCPARPRRAAWELDPF